VLVKPPLHELAVITTHATAFVPTSILRLQVDSIHGIKIPRSIAQVEISILREGNTCALTTIQLTEPVANPGNASSQVIAASKLEVPTTLPVPICVAANVLVPKFVADITTKEAIAIAFFIFVFIISFV
jgi:hypothetical protein